MVTLAAGAIITALSLTAVPAGAEAGFWRSAGLRGVDAFGVYRTHAARATLSFLLKDVKKDRAVAAVRFTFTERHHGNSVRVAALRPGAHRAWQTVSSANTGHLYVQECVGTWHRKVFRTKKCAGWRRRY
ncbi:hypothetical protein [Actinoallomurus bryophytorum]|nr:hypothetical protein [Actinoallomurus bryophytorum]